MGYVAEIDGERLDEPAIRGRYHKVAVDCWFTSQGKSIPHRLKYQDQDGVVHMLPEIRILRSERKYYAGILLQKYDCSAIVEGRQQNFLLLYHPGENRWDMVFAKGHF